jgi:hypothetical protein
MEVNMAKYEFDILVANITRAQAEALLKVITAFVENIGGKVGGGFTENEEADDDENA